MPEPQRDDDRADGTRPGNGSCLRAQAESNVGYAQQMITVP